MLKASYNVSSNSSMTKLPPSRAAEGSINNQYLGSDVTSQNYF